MDLGACASALAAALFALLLKRLSRRTLEAMLATRLLVCLVFLAIQHSPFIKFLFYPRLACTYSSSGDLSGTTFTSGSSNLIRTITNTSNICSNTDTNSFCHSNLSFLEGTAVAAIIMRSVVLLVFTSQSYTSRIFGEVLPEIKGPAKSLLLYIRDKVLKFSTNICTLLHSHYSMGII